MKELKPGTEETSPKLHSSAALLFHENNGRRQKTRAVRERSVASRNGTAEFSDRVPRFTRRPETGRGSRMKAANAEPEIVTRNGKPVSVILPIKKYQEMIERLEDAKDVAWLKRARRKKLHFRPLEDVLADLPQR